MQLWNARNTTPSYGGLFCVLLDLNLLNLIIAPSTENGKSKSHRRRREVSYKLKAKPTEP